MLYSCSTMETLLVSAHAPKIYQDEKEANAKEE